MDEVIPIWPSLPPGALGQDPEKDIPTLTVFQPPPDRAAGTAVVVCPGGGYWELMDYEGRDCALWLNERGITAFVLKYRLAAHGYHHPEITSDVLRAIRCVRSRAAEWRIDPARIGVMGGSAGGHLASYAMTHFENENPAAQDPVDRAGSRPDFGILSYPVITILPQNINLLGDSPDPSLAGCLSSDLHVTQATPPCFLWHTQDDKTVSVENSLRFAHALHQHGVSFSLHIYPSGEHGMGLGVKGYKPGTNQSLHPWTVELDLWLSEQRLSRSTT